MECILLSSFSMVVGKVVDGWIGVKKEDEIKDLRERFSCK